MKSKITEIQQIYRDIKRIYKKIMDLKPFEKYGRNDCFHFMDEKDQGMAIFSDMVWKGNPGIQMFLNKPGLNHVHELVTCPNSYGYDRAFANLKALTYLPKEDLDDMDKKFLKKMKANITANNLVVIILKEGYGFTQPNKTDLLEILTNLNYLHSIISNDEEQIKEIFNNELMALGVFNNKDYTYNVVPLPDISFETMPSFKKVNIPFVEEASNYCYINEKCHIGRLYIPIKDKENDFFTSVVFMYFENQDKWFTNLIDCKPEKIGEYMYAFIDEIFKANGMPDEVVISDRYLFAGISKTLKKLNISTILFREENDFAKGCYGKLAEVMSKLDFFNKALEGLSADEEEDFIQNFDDSDDLLDYEDDFDDDFLSEEVENSFVA